MGGRGTFASDNNVAYTYETVGKIDGVKNYNTSVKKRGDDITFLRRIVKGPADGSYGVEVAKLAGVPDSVIKRAKEIVEKLSVINTDINKPAPINAEQDDDQMGFGAISLVSGKAVFGIDPVIFIHYSVPGHLGQNAGCGGL